MQGLLSEQLAAAKRISDEKREITRRHEQITVPPLTYFFILIVVFCWYVVLGRLRPYHADCARRLACLFVYLFLSRGS